MAGTFKLSTLQVESADGLKTASLTHGNDDIVVLNKEFRSNGGGIRLGTAAASTSGTAIDFVGIPSWAKRITVMFNGVSTNGSTSMRIQLGTSGGFENTGYAGAWVQSISGSATGTGAFTSGFDVFSGGATSLRSGGVAITSMGNNSFVAKGVLGDPDGRGIMLGGSKTLSGVLDRIRITTVNGTDTFDAGSINISWEG